MAHEILNGLNKSMSTMIGEISPKGKDTSESEKQTSNSSELSADQVANAISATATAKATELVMDFYKGGGIDKLKSEVNSKYQSDINKLMETIDPRDKDALNELIDINVKMRMEEQDKISNASTVDTRITPGDLYDSMRVAGTTMSVDEFNSKMNLALISKLEAGDVKGVINELLHNGGTNDMTSERMDANTSITPTTRMTAGVKIDDIGNDKFRVTPEGGGKPFNLTQEQLVDFTDDLKRSVEAGVEDIKAARLYEQVNQL